MQLAINSVSIKSWLPTTLLLVCGRDYYTIYYKLLS
jgi:hypothetical protein